MTSLRPEKGEELIRNFINRVRHEHDPSEMATLRDAALHAGEALNLMCNRMYEMEMTLRKVSAIQPEIDYLLEPQ